MSNLILVRLKVTLKATLGRMRVGMLCAATCLAGISAAAEMDACKLLTAKDASAVVGQPLTVAAHTGGVSCSYFGAGGAALLGVEITLRLEADPAAARAYFPRWVSSVNGGRGGGPAVAPVPGVGDQASIVRSNFVNAVVFRRGKTLIKIGVHPPVPDASLKKLAAAVLGRL